MPNLHEDPTDGHELIPPWDDEWDVPPGESKDDAFMDEEPPLPSDAWAEEDNRDHGELDSKKRGEVYIRVFVVSEEDLFWLLFYNFL